MESIASRKIPKARIKKIKTHPRQKKKKQGINVTVEPDYKKLYEESPNLQRTINKDGIIIACNQSYARSLGYSKNEIIGKSIFVHVAKKSLEAMRDSFETWKRFGSVENKEVIFQRKDDTTFPVLISATNIYDNDDKLVGSNTIIRDITDIYYQKKRLQENQEQMKYQYYQIKKINDLLTITEKRYRTLYDKTPVLLRTITTEGVLTDCNEAYAKALGYTKKEAAGMSIYYHTAERSINDMKNNFETWKRTHETQSSEIWLKRKDESIFPTLLSGTSLYNEHGKLIGRTLALADMTEIYEARSKLELNEHQLREQYEKLQKLDSLKDDFLTMITHELKTPLVPIKGYIDILLSGNLGGLNEEQKKRMEIIKASTNSLLKLVSDLLDAQKIELGVLKMSKDVYDLSEIIRNVVNRMKPNLDGRGITITTDLEESMPLLCDSVRIEQVLTNLIANSLDFCPKQDGRIEIKLFAENSNAKIIVKDNGAGISKESLDKIFVKFYQIDTSVTREHGGTGIGLSVCKGLIEAHGGKIWAKSEGLNKGTEMHILFPKF